MQIKNFDVLVIGGGPAGLAAAISAEKNNASVLLLEREERLGGILKQCIHDGFGVVRFGKKMAGCEYAQVFINELRQTPVVAEVLSFVTKIEKTSEGGFHVTYSSKEGIQKVTANAIVLSTGCRERTAKQVQIHGTRPSGVLTAGAAQYYTNILGYLPGKNCVILGSGDIGLIMARRLTLEGATVLGVYEAKSTPSGLRRNISQCLDDFDIPLYCSKTVTRAFGSSRLTGVEVCSVDEQMNPIEETKEYIPCDTLILSVGLIPENEIAEGLGVEIDKRTKGPITDNHQMTSVNGVFVCGNAWQVSDLADYVSLSGERAGKYAAFYGGKKEATVCVDYEGSFLYMVPQKVTIDTVCEPTAFYFRSNKEMDKSKFTLKIDQKEVYTKIYSSLRPPEMQKIEIDFSKYSITPSTKIAFTLSEVIK